MDSQIDMSNEIALVTGGGSGMGASIAVALAEAGATVFILGRNLEKLQQVVDSQSTERITPLQCDVSNYSEVAETVAKIESEYGPIGILINAAGVNVPKRMMDELSVEDWDRMMAINSSGTFYAMRSVLPGMRTRGQGTIINISSISAKRPGPLGGVGYNASKYAQTGLSLTVTDEERMKGIRVTTVYPGEVETPILEQRPQAVSAERRSTMLQPEDVTAAIMMVLTLPQRAHVPELVIKPLVQSYLE
ncbi:SDR family oxidoreductase [Calycomorphotria hydatis]|uniref:Putative oxidoreductase n=1 Tax=Calycomorphotria hydatis TaxID=2528027 RepID=A0A517T6Y0_9PLAN|nr:SDR family oxidoreductase [Calycomorphotria hydatis]QDT64128.1 putative oxidoreductase [Calycomorphotria hydatis]